MPSVKNKFSWWERRTRIEKGSLIVITLCAALIIYLASNLFMKFPSGGSSASDSICLTQKCILSASTILRKMDTSANPCKDFYKFACGGFLKAAIIPDNDLRISTFSHTAKKVQRDLRLIFEEPILEDDTKSLVLIKTVYQTCMNTSKIEREGLSQVKKIFFEFGGWPVIDPAHWNERNFDWKKVLYNFRKIGWRYNIFVTLHVDTDKKNSSQRILTVTQPCMNVERIKKAYNDTYVPALYDFLVDLAVIFGADKIYAESEMRQVIDFEIELAKILVPREERKNRSLEYNPMTIRRLQNEVSSIPWLQFINSYLAPVEKLTSDDVINVALPHFLTNLEDLLSRTKKKILANYIFSRILIDFIPFLPEKLRNSELKFMKVAFGQYEPNPRWKDCVNAAKRLHVAISATYVKNYFNKENRHKVSELVLDVKGSFMETLRKIVWMDRKTKKHAMIKAEKMGHRIGYPEEILNNSAVEEYYKSLDLNINGTYLDINLNLSIFSHISGVKKLREHHNVYDWISWSFSFSVNAFYYSPQNSIDLPAGILQEDIYDLERPQYLNYGSLGPVIGHEITHGFDDYGRQYDKDGNLLDWWEAETNKTFTRKSQCLVEQYSNLTVPEIGMKLNGVRTLDENIADNGGVKIAYKGYMRWLERNKKEPMLPGLPYTPKQMFWIAAASNFCTKYKKETLKHMIMSGRHSPSYFRVTIPFMNSDNFGRDFNCKLGSLMNPKYKCRVW